jgi:hypothetical protein
MAAAGLGVMAWTLADPDLTHELMLQIGVFCFGLFLACMFCHGELARLKPAPRHLTRFYLMVSLGGAAGSVLVGIVAPLVLPAYFELAAGLVLCAVLLLWQVRRDVLVFPALAIASILATVGCGIWSVVEFYDGTIATARNFYGVLRVQEHGANTANDRRSLVHGSIMHGTQYSSPEFRRQPTSYYTATSGIGRLLEILHPSTKPLRVGAIGLGAGTLATYGSKGDVYRFYDINPDVITIARRDFTFLADGEATIETPLGDARLKLEREPAQGFDVLAVDAFSSDAIPLHLITSEAVAIYKRHLATGGVIAFHVTNRFLDLVPVVEALARSNGLDVIHIADDGDDPMAARSDWLLLSEDAALLARPELAEFAGKIEDTEVRKEFQAYVDGQLVNYHVGKKQAEPALELIRKGELTHVHRAWALTQVAKFLVKTDRETATQLVEEAATEARRIEVSDANRPRALVAVAYALKEVDPARLWDATFDAVKAANSAEGFTGEDGELLLQFQSKHQSSVNTNDVPDFDLDGLFKELANQDYDRAVELARGFEREGPRAVATISIARAVLEPKKK